jgi:nucleoside-diphosphate-sugar epimerase
MIAAMPDSAVTIAITGPTETFGFGLISLLFYARKKALIERLLEQEAARRGDLGVYLLRPAVVLGPDVIGAVPVQFIHEDDVGQAFLLCIVAAAFAGWAEAFSHPAIMEASKAKRELGWRPRYSSLPALRDPLKART